MSNSINGSNYTQSLWWVSKKNSEQNKAQEEQPEAEVQSDTEIQQSLIAPERVLELLGMQSAQQEVFEINKPVTNNGNLQNVSTLKFNGYEITLSDEIPRTEYNEFFDQVNGQFVTDLPEDEFDPKATLTIKTPDGDIHKIDILCDATTRTDFANRIDNLFSALTVLPENVLDIMGDELDFINLSSHDFGDGDTLGYVYNTMNGIFLSTGSNSVFSEKTLVHELGHALDNYGTLMKETFSISDKAFNQFKQKLIALCPELENNYALSSVQEFWAEYFCQKNLDDSLHFSKILNTVENAKDKEGYDSVNMWLNAFTTVMDEKIDNVLSYDKDIRKDTESTREEIKEDNLNNRHKYEEDDYYIPVSEDEMQAIGEKLTDRSIIEDFNALAENGLIDYSNKIIDYLVRYQKDPAFCKDMAYQKFHDYQKAVYNIEESVRKMNEHPDKFDPAELKAWNDKAQSHLKALEETEKMLDSFFEKCDKVIDSLHDDYFLAQNDTKPVNNSEETKKPNSSQPIDKSETTSQTEALQKPVENQQQTPSKPVQEIQQQVSNKPEAQKPQNQPVPESPKEEETVQETPKPADPVQPDIQKPQEAPADTVEPDVTDTPETTTPAAPSQPEKQPDVTDSKEPEKAEELEQPVESKPLNPQTTPDRTPQPENNTNPPVSNPQPTVPENRPFVPKPFTPSNNDVDEIPNVPDAQPEPETPDVEPDITPDLPTSELPELPDTPDITDGELAPMPDVTVDSGHIAPEFEIETNRGPNEEITLETKPKEMTDEEKAAFEQALKDKYGEDKNYDISYNADGSVDWKVSDSGSSITGENQSSNQTPAEPAEPQTPAPESSKPGTEPLPEPSIAPEIPDISDDLPAPGNTDSKDNNAQDNNIPGSQEIEAPPIAPETPNIADDLPAPAPADTTTPGNTTTSDSDNADKDTAEDAAPGSQEIEAPSLAQEPSKPSGFTPITVDESREPQNQTPTYAGVGINVGDYTNSNGTIDTDRLTQDWADNGGEVFTYDNQSDINDVWNAAVSAEQSGNWGGFWDGLGSGSSMGSTGSDPFADISGDFNVFEVGGGGGGNNPFAIQFPTGSSSGKIHKFHLQEMKLDLNK